MLHWFKENQKPGLEEKWKQPQKYMYTERGMKDKNFNI